MGASANAGGNLTIDAKRDVAVVASQVSAAGNGAITAGENLVVSSAADEDHVAHKGRRYSRVTDSVTQAASGISAGSDLAMSAGGDLSATASKLEAKGDVSLAAGGDMTLASAADESHFFAQGKRTTDQKDKITQIATTVTAGGSASLTAGNDLTVVASQVAAKEDAHVYAGNDLNVVSAQNTDYSFYEKTKKGHWGKKSYQMTESESVAVASASIQAGGTATLVAANDVNVVGSSVSSGEGSLSVLAGNDINLAAAQSSEYQASAKSKSGGLGLSTTSKMSSDASSSTTLIGATLSGNKTLVQAGHDISVSASNVVSTELTNVQARNDVRIESAAEVCSSEHIQQTKKSGLLSTGGVGVTLGSSKNKLTLQSTGGVEKGSTVGSVQGDVNIIAGKDLLVKASDVVGGTDVNLIGENVNIVQTQNQNITKQTQESKKSGLTLALSGVVGDAVNTAVQTVQAAKQEDDSRLAALQGVKAGLSGYQAYQGAQALGAGAQTGSFVGISLSLGSESSSSKQMQTQSVSQGTSITAANNLNIVATGSSGANDGDINVIGSKLQAGQDMLLAANRDINLLAAANTQKLDGSNKSGGANVGISFGVGSSGAGPSIFANANSAKGNEKGDGTTWAESTLDAGQKLTLKSGQDTVVRGAQANAQQVVAVIGRDLTLASLQDSDKYDSKQTSVSGGISATLGGGASGSLSVSQDKLKSNFISVQEQTGLFAGKDGYQVTVGNHTQLNGAVIASTAAAGKNLLDTGTLGWTSLDNQAKYSASHQSVSANTSGNAGSMFIGNMGSLLLVGANGAGNDSSSTSSAVSEGIVVVRNSGAQQQDVKTLSHDVEHANNSVSPIFDKEKEQNRLRQAQLIGEIGSQAMDIIRTQGSIEAAKALKDPQKLQDARLALVLAGNPDPTDKEVANQVTNSVMFEYGTGSNLQKAAQAVTAAVQALTGGNIAQALVGAAAPYVANQIKDITGDNTAANLMAHAVLGAVLAKSQGNDALAGAAGASIGELVANQLYPSKKASELTEAEKQTVSALSTLAGGLAGALVGGDSASAVAAGAAAQNAVNNNHLSTLDKFVLGQLQREYEEASCASSGSVDCQAMRSKIDALVAKDGSVLKKETDVVASDFGHDQTYIATPGDVKPCSGSASGYCVVTDKTVVTNLGEEWVLQPLSEEQAVVGRAANAVRDAGSKAILKSTAEQLFAAGCGGMGIAATACQAATASGWANPISGVPASGEERVLMGAQVVLSAIGLGVGAYVGWKEVDSAVSAGSLEIDGGARANASGPTSGLASGEIKVIGTGKPAANDASFAVPKGYTQELDGSVTGPGGGVYKATGALDSSGNQIYLGGNGNYYTLTGEGSTRIVSPNPSTDIGSTGQIGENALKSLGGQSQVSFQTSQGARFVDQLAPGNIAHESKVGYTSLDATTALQVAKDAELLSRGMVNGITWNFYTSPVTGRVGASPSLLKALSDAGIKVVVH